MRNPLPKHAALVTAISLAVASMTFAAELSTSSAQRAEQFVEALAAGDFASGHANFDATVARQMSAEKLQATWAALQMQAGKFLQHHGTREESHAPYAITHVTCEFAKAWIDVRMVFNQTGQIAGLQFLPTRRSDQQIPPYAKPDSFTEVPVEFGDPDWRLPGTLSLPKGNQRFPAVILVHGSGPNDRDETVGANKPFRDLAWGLASHGIAVLRYDKRTRAHQAKLAGVMAGFTAKDEVIEDVGHALAFLRQHADIDPQRVFVLGHSLGGMLAPRIARDYPGVAGLAILAGATRPLEDMMLEQVEYIARLDGTVSAEEQKQLDQLKALAAHAKTLTAKDATDPTPLLGVAPSYWLDLRAYDATATAAKLPLPILILQGDRDYQVTGKDLANWRQALANRPNVQFKTYPALNHLFIAGTGKSGPAEYQTPGFFSDEVVRDVTAFVGLSE
ncbi:MAG TPA: alpha/beta fold hydrolase [Verrucomicrobiae bacterium]|nr:alpha/beta fold hydrolase [Verrucomicrobiae bacterium]